MSISGEFKLYLAYVNSMDGTTARVKVPSLTGPSAITVPPSDAAGWTAPAVGDQRFVAVSGDLSDVRWVV